MNSTLVATQPRQQGVEPEPPQESSDRGFGLGLLAGTVAGIALSAIVSAWFRRNAKMKKARQPPAAHAVTRAPVSRSAFLAAPAGCAVRPNRTFGAALQLPSLAAPAALDEPVMLPPGTAITVTGVWVGQIDADGRFRCDVIRPGSATIWGAYLGSDDFQGACRVWFERAVNGVEDYAAVA